MTEALQASRLHTPGPFFSTADKTQSIKLPVYTQNSVKSLHHNTVSLISDVLSRSLSAGIFLELKPQRPSSTTT